MKSEQTILTTTPFVGVTTASPKSGGRAPASSPWQVMLVLGIFMFVCGAAVGTALFLGGGEKNPNALQSFLAQKHSLILGAMSVSLLMGSILIIVSAIQMGRCEKQWKDVLNKRSAEIEGERATLQTQLSETQKLFETAHHDFTAADLRATTLARTNEQMQDELNKLRLAERAREQQTRALERSKGVLELNVQSRNLELQKLQRRSEGILNAAGEGICGFDVSGKIVFANPAASKITGWEISEILGKTEKEFLRGASDSTDAGESFAADKVFLRKDDVNFQAEYTRTNIYEGERVVGAVVMFKDITERKLSEERLAQKAADLARSNSELEQFAFVASHDLQEPLRKIQAFGERLKTKCATLDLGEGLDYLERMQNASARMQRLINDLLTYSRSIRSSEPFAPVDLNIAVKEVLSDLEVRIEQNKATVEVAPLPTIDADPTQVRQLLQNLLSNALKFHAPGAKPVIKVSGKILDGVCELTVEDNGIGFEEQYNERIFAVFQRLHGRTEYEGTGVGLAVCRKITDRHGGKISARSKVGEGATFTVTLPAKQQQAQPA